MLVKDFTPNGTGDRTFSLQGRNGKSGFVPGAINGKLLFRAHGEELWISDGTAEGTRLVKDIFPGKTTESTQSALLWEFKNRTFFLADDGGV